MKSVSNFIFFSSCWFFFFTFFSLWSYRIQWFISIFKIFNSQFVAYDLISFGEGYMCLWENGQFPTYWEECSLDICLFIWFIVYFSTELSLLIFNLEALNQDLCGLLCLLVFVYKIWGHKILYINVIGTVYVSICNMYVYVMIYSQFYIFLMDCSLLCMYCLPLRISSHFALMSTLWDIRMATPGFSQILSAW